ncbi:tyrosine-type recombinase/integrase [Stappia indica]|uniref:tyrosine-type recombinase/integrase n=1 Tax=Stappia indica TaxID=538381 RepID=UPI00082C6076|nr:site-specific integrase [Stappia indica]
MGFVRAQAASLYSHTGQRKYLTQAERTRFLDAAARCGRAELRTLCLVLAWTGCRISEALALTERCIEVEAGFVAVRTLKRRGCLVIREIPVPPDLIRDLVCVHGIDSNRPDRKLWALSRSRAWTLIKDMMREADVHGGVHATPKGLRHGFGLHAIRSGVPISMVQKWMGHARMETTAIYLQATGPEEREMAEKMWG